MLDEAFAQIALAVSDAVNGPYHPAVLRWPGVPVTDDGGSIATPGEPEEYPCSVQVDAVTEAMRTEASYTDRDVRLLILAPALTRAVDTDATVQLTAGPHAGAWMIASVTRDPLGFAYDGRGRRA